MIKFEQHPVELVDIPRNIDINHLIYQLVKNRPMETVLEIPLTNISAD
jgi:hypothetical protein